MVIRGDYMFEFSVSKDNEKKIIKKRIPTYHLTLIVIELKSIVEHGKVLRKLYMIKY